MTFPACFSNQNEFNMWMHWRDVSKEKVTICGDCTDEYKAEMQLQERCHPPASRSIATPAKEIIRKCRKCGEDDPEKFHTSRYYICKPCMNAYKRERNAKYSGARVCG